MAIHDFIHTIEVGLGRRLLVLGALFIATVFIGVIYVFTQFRGLDSIESMDNAQLAESVASGRGFTTRIIRPNVVAQLREFYETSGGDAVTELNLMNFPETSRAPLYPYLLGVIFKVIGVDFYQDARDTAISQYRPEFVIVFVNQAFVLGTAVILLFWSGRMFDSRVGWLSATAFIFCNLIWQFSITAQATCLVIFLLTGLLACLHEAICADERDESLYVWLWLLGTALLFVLCVYTQFFLVWILLPLAVFLFVAFRFRLLPAIVAILISVLAILPWYYHLYSLTGNPLGSNLQLLVASQNELGASEVERDLTVASEGQVREFLRKSVVGLTYAIENFFSRTGSSLIILLFLVCLMHPFKRRRVQLFRLFLLSLMLVLVLATSLIFPDSGRVSELNGLILLWPGLAAFGGAYFFVLLDRSGISLSLLRGIVITVFLAICALPLVLQILPPGEPRFRYPPYHPPMLRYLEGSVEDEQLLMSDMAWATAWYSKRNTLLLPRTLGQFYTVHQEIQPIKGLLLTPVTWREGLMDIDKGKLEDWSILIRRQGIPEGFPLPFPIALPPNDNEYLFFSDEKQWQVR